MFNAEYSEKEYLFNKYRSYLKHSKDVTDVITEIKEKTNTYPLTHNNDELYYEGYWYDGSKFNKKYPIPILTEEKNSDDFVDKLKLYMKNTEPHQQYFGSSYCRICDACNGGSEYKIDTDDMSIVFPSGLLHYYEMHNVKPSTEFYNVIVALKFDFMNLS